MNVVPIQYFEDNLAYAVYVENSPFLVLVDPADIDVVNDFLRHDPRLMHLFVAGVFFTHKHADHCRDSTKIALQYPNIPIIIGRLDAVKGCNRLVNDNEVIALENGIQVTCLSVPCHTRGHMLYLFQHCSYSVLFTGDTLFVGGCGKFFEGNAHEMYLNFQKISRLPESCEIYCGHEYTVANLQWATKVDKSNSAMAQKLEWAINQCNNRRLTVPSTVLSELQTNIFFQTDRLAHVLCCNSPVDAFNKLRTMKNQGQTL